MVNRSQFSSMKLVAFEFSVHFWVKQPIILKHMSQVVCTKVDQYNYRVLKRAQNMQGGFATVFSANVSKVPLHPVFLLYGSNGNTRAV